MGGLAFHVTITAAIASDAKFEWLQFLLDAEAGS
jgi:hypothetical protein